MEDERKREYARAIRAYRKTNESRWVFNFHASRIVGKYGRGGTIDLANAMGVENDTVEDSAHAFWMFDKLRSMGGQAERVYVNWVRKLPYIYYSHFRALYDLQQSRHLTDEQLMSILIDIEQSKGKISSRKLEDHVHSRFGDTRTWEFYGAKALKALSKTEGQPDLPNTPEQIGVAYAITFDVDGESVNFVVVAFNKFRAEEIARKQLRKDVGDEVELISKCTGNKILGKAMTDSKNILNVTSSWLGDNA